MGTELLVILLLLLVNGLFAMTEMAVVSARKARLKRLADQGDQRARAALALAESPNRFLSTVQVGITLVSVLAGAFGGATIAGEIAAALEPVSVLAPYAEAIGVSVVVVAITYGLLVIGELVPKRLAHVPCEGEFFEAQGFRVEVIGMDRHRADRILIEPLPGRFPKPAPDQQETPRQ